MNNVEELQKESVSAILEYLKGPRAVKESKDAKFGVNLAVKALSAVGRIKATERAKDGMQLEVLRHISKDAKQFEKYVQASLPHLNPVKQIEGK